MPLKASIRLMNCFQVGRIRLDCKRNEIDLYFKLFFVYFVIKVLFSFFLTSVTTAGFLFFRGEP